MNTRSMQRQLAGNSKPPTPKRGRFRRGNVVLLSAFLMIVIMAMVAFAVDVGYICLARTELQRAVDAAALAGAGELQFGEDRAREAAKEYIVRNGVAVHDGSGMPDYSAALADFNANHAQGLSILIGQWDKGSRTFAESTNMPSTLRVSMEYRNLPLFFAHVLGKDSFKIRCTASAMYHPRDIVVVLDYSASMNDDSEFSAFGKLGRSEVEANLLEIYGDLGSPVYGNMTFPPEWATVPGVPQNDAQQVPHVTVQYQFNKVYITSTKDINQVRLEFSGGTAQTFAGTGQTALFQGTGGNAGRQITRAYVKSWNNHVVYPSNGESFTFGATTLKNGLGLTNVPYPYASGSWDEYINWAISNANDNQNKNAGYRYKFGYMNWIVWMLETKPGNNQTADLWKVRAEPMAALKTSMDVFMDFITTVQTGDRVGLSVYNSPGGEGKLEVPLTFDFNPAVSNNVKAKQAGHYHQYTNIGGGLRSGRREMEDNARAAAAKMIVLMTDGQANWVNGNYNENAANGFLLAEARACADSGIPVMCISLGAEADTTIMQEVAEITKGKHYNVPGGSSQQDYYDQLYEVFEEIAAAKPLQMVD